jgi:hypothetical protein
VAFEVADHPVDLEPVVLVDQRPGRLLERGLRDVQRYVAAEGAGTLHGSQQHPRLLGGARAELDKLTGADLGDDLIGALGQDLHLGPRRVVLGQLADQLEQLRAARVVEMLWRQFLERAGESVQHVVGQHPLGRLVEERVDRDCVGAVHHRSLAIRTPAKIWRRWGKSQLRNVGVATRARVAQEAPRSTL